MQSQNKDKIVDPVICLHIGHAVVTKTQGELSDPDISKEKAVAGEDTTEEIEDDIGIITQDTETMDSQTNFMEDESVQSLEEFMEDIEYETWVSKSSKKKQTRKAKGGFSVAPRTSNRVPKDGRIVLEKATQLAKERDDFSKGKNAANQFLVLNSLSNDEIKSVADSLDISIENIDDQIEVFKAEERVRAALAEANYREYLASVNKKTAPQGDEDLQEFALSVVDNSARGIADISSTKSSKAPHRGRGRPRKKV